MNRIKNEYIKRNLGITKGAGEIWENRLRWFGILRVDDNNETTKKIDETRVEGKSENR